MSMGVRCSLIPCSRLVVPVAACSLLVTACREYQALAFVNGTRQAVDISYSANHYYADPMGIYLCPLGLSAPKSSRREPPYRNQESAEFFAASIVDYDERKCRLTIRVDPGMTIVVNENGPCSDDYERYLKRMERSGLDAPPRVIQLTISGPGRSDSWDGWDVVKQFKRRTDQWCVLKIS